MKLTPQAKRDLCSATIIHSLWLILACSGLLMLTSYGADPAWWSSRGAVLPPEVTTNSGVVTTNYASNDFAVVTQGQLKQFTVKAVDELNTGLTNNGGAGTNLNSLVQGWALDYATNGYSATNIKPSDYTAMNVGQLKYIGHLIWTPLVSVGYTNAAPGWLAPNTNSDNALAIIGQLKTVFNFDLSDFHPEGAAVPEITSAATITTPVGLAMSYTITASNDPTHFDASGLPAGLSLNATTGVISGTPTSSGVNGVMLSVTNSAGIGFGFIAINVTTSTVAPVINSPGTALALADAPFAYQITATHSPQQFGVASLAPGLSLNTRTGAITGTVETAGTYTQTLSATNSFGSGTKELILTVVSAESEGAGAPVLSDITDTATQGTAYTRTLTATGATSFGATGLPDGLSINSTSGVISGIPTVYGTFHPVVFASNSAGTGASFLALTVAPATPAITSPTAVTIPVDKPFTYQMTSTLVSPTWTATNCPSWLSFNTNAGILSGTPTSTGTNTVGLGASIPGYSATNTLTIAVTALPLLTGPTEVIASVGSPFEFSILTATPATSFTASSLPPGLSFDTETGTISGSPVVMGTYTVAITATNAAGTSSGSLLITVDFGPNATPAITSPSVAHVASGSNLVYTITANNSPTNFASSGLPTWLTNGTTPGVLSGTAPTNYPSASIGTVNASGQGGTATAPLTIVIGSGTRHTLTQAFRSGVVPFSSYRTISASIATNPDDVEVENYFYSDLIVGNPWGSMIYRGLVGFDLSSLPPDANVTSVSLELMARGGATISGTATTVDLYEAAPFTSTTASWTYNHVPGTSRLSTMTANTPSTDTVETWPSDTPFVDAVQTAVGNGAPLALMLRLPSTTEAGVPTSPRQYFEFDGETDSTESHRPLLVVTYTTEEPPIVSNPGTIIVSSQIPWEAPPLVFANTGDAATYSGSGVFGLSVDATTGAITGTPTASGVFTLTATNANGTASTSFAVTLGTPPTITNTTLTASGIVGVPFDDYTITASQSPTSYEAEGLPPGLSCNASTGVISGTPVPLYAGIYPITLKATNGFGTGTATLSLDISPVVPSFNGPLPVLSGYEGFDFDYALMLSETNPFSEGIPDTLEFDSSLAADLAAIGITLNESGTINGNPTGSGTFTGTVTASNSAGTSVAEPITIVITPLPAPVIQPLTLYAVDGVALQYYRLQAAVAVSEQSYGDYGVSNYSAPGLAAYGLAINADTGEITGTPGSSVSSGTYSVTATAENIFGTQGTGTITLNIYSSGPGIKGPLVDTATVAQPYTYLLQTVPGASGATSTSATGLPPGLAFTNNGASGTIEGIPTIAGTYNVTLTATDLGSHTSTATLVLTVNPVASPSYHLDFQEGVSPALSYTTPSITVAKNSLHADVAEGTYSTSGTVLPVGRIESPAHSSEKADSRALVTFDLSALPPQAVVTGVSLVVNPASGSASSAVEVQVHQTSDFNPATADWNHDSFLYPDLLGSQTVDPAHLKARTLFIGTTAFAKAVQQAFTNSGKISLALSAPAVEGGTATAQIGISTRATDPTLNPRLVVTYTLGEETDAPVITSSGGVSGTVGSPVSYAITGTHEPTGYGATGLPSPLSVNTSTGAISGTVTNAVSTVATVFATNTAGMGSREVTFAIDSATQADDLHYISGGDQSGMPGSYLALPLVAQAIHSSANLAGTLVTFTVPADGGALSTTNTGTATATRLSIPTGSDGKASVYLRLPYTPRTTAVTATAGTASALTYVETAAWGSSVPTSGMNFLSIVGGNGQAAASGNVLSSPLTVRLVNAFGQAISGASLTFTAAEGQVCATSGGTFVSSVPVNTNLDGQSSFYWKTSGSAGDLNHVTCSVANATPVSLVAFVEGSGSPSVPTPGGGTPPETDGDPLPPSEGASYFLNVGASVVFPFLPDPTKAQLHWNDLGGVISHVLKRVDLKGAWVDLGGKSSGYIDPNVLAGHDYFYQVRFVKDGQAIGTTNINSYNVPLIKGFHGISAGFQNIGLGFQPAEALVELYKEPLLSYELHPEWYTSPFSSTYIDHHASFPAAWKGTYSYSVRNMGNVHDYYYCEWSKAEFYIDFNPTDTSEVSTFEWVEICAKFPFSTFNRDGSLSANQNSYSTTSYPHSTTIVSNGQSAVKYFFNPLVSDVRKGEIYQGSVKLKFSVPDGYGAYLSQADALGVHELESGSNFSLYVLDFAAYSNNFDIDPNLFAAVGEQDPVILTFTGPIEVEGYIGISDINPSSLSSGVSLKNNCDLIIIPNADAPDGSAASVTLTSAQRGSTTANFIIHNRSPHNDLSIPIDEASGSRYRKIALHGLPLSDEKPQQSAESDQEHEETYIDALTAGLRHSTTDVYLPVSGSDLTVSARRDLRSQTWSNAGGLRPHEQPDLAFGPCWSSNLSPNIRFTTHSNPKGKTPDMAYVTDEAGAVHTFVLWYDPETNARKFFPMPTAKNEQQVPNLESLTANNTSPVTYTFSRKYGTTLTYQETALKIVTNENRLTGSLYMNIDKYARLLLARDRVGNVVNYQYVGNTNLIPATITVANQPDLKLSIQQTAIKDLPGSSSTNPQSVITAIWDAKGNKTSYGYAALNSDTGTEADDKAWVLTSVTTPDGAVTAYHYSAQTETDPTPKPAGQPDTIYWYADLASISDPLTNKYEFTYELDHSKLTYIDNELVHGYFPQLGSPRNITSVVLPGSLGTASFDNSKSKVRLEASGTGPTLAGTRQLTVTDASGFHRTYKFGNPSVVSLPRIPGPAGFSSSATKIIAYQDLSIDYGTGSSYFGHEEFQFDLGAAMALKQITDFSGNTTVFEHSDTWTAPADYQKILTLAGATLNGHYDDPTKQTNALGGGKSFTYDLTTRIMTGVEDENHNTTTYDIDGKGRRTSEKLSDLGHHLVQQTDFKYEDTAHPGFMTLKKVKALSGGADPSWSKDLVTQYLPDENGRLAQEIIDPSGLHLITKYTYDANGNKVTATDPNGHTTWFGYDTRNRLTTVTFADGTQKQMVYDARGNKRIEYDENGLKTLFDYDSLNRLTRQVRDMDGNSGFNDSTHTLTNIGGADLVTNFTYNAVNSKLTSTDPNGGVTTMTYDGMQRVTQIEDALHHISTLGYGANSGGNAFDSSSFKPTHSVSTRAAGNVITDVTYDALYRPKVSAVRYQAGAPPATTSTEYDAVGNPYLVTDPLGNQTEVVYDALNRPTKTIAPDDTFTETFYTSTGFKWKTVDANGNINQVEYDSAGRPVTAISPVVADGLGGTASAITRTYYDAASNVVETVNPLLQVWDYAYDARNRKRQEFQPAVLDADPLSPSYSLATRPVITWEYDAAGRTTAAIDARNGRTTTTYDNANRVTVVHQAEIAWGTGTTNPETTSTYDKNGNVLTVTDPNGHTTTNTYDALNRLLTTQDAENITVTNTYDEAGNKLTVTDGCNHATTFTYDGLNRNTSIIDAAGKATRFRYDAVNKTQRIDSKGQITAYVYDVRNRLEHVLYNSTDAANSQRDYAYDANGNLRTVTEPAKTGANVEYHYDALNRAIDETSGGVTHTYTYDLAGNRLKTVYGGTGREIDSEYDALNRLLQMTENGRTSTYAYDLNGNAVEKTLPNGDTEVAVFDALNRSSSQTTTKTGGGSLYTFGYDYDLGGNVTTVTEDYPSGLQNRTVSNTYDAINRLLVETVTGDAPHSVTTYVYDHAHNRTSKAVTGTGAATTNYVYNPLNQLTGYTDGTRHVALTYDLNGNRTTRVITGGSDNGTDSYSYDFENRLIGVTKGTTGDGVGTYSYAYDYRTRRIFRDESGISGSITHVVFSGGTSVQEYDGSATTPTVEYIRGSDYGGGVGGILYTLRDSGTRPSYTHENKRGDVVAKTGAPDSGGEVHLTFQTQYEAFGKQTDTVGTTEDRQKSNSKDCDRTGLANEGFRYRDLETGMFITRDPAGFVDGPNLYTYVVQNPWTKFDPEGLATEWHHELPVEYKTKFAEIGIDIDESKYGRFISDKSHTELHKLDYNAQWEKFFKAMKDNGVPVAARKQLAETYLDGLKFLPQYKDILQAGAAVPEGLGYKAYSNLSSYEKYLAIGGSFSAKKSGEVFKWTSTVAEKIQIRAAQLAKLSGKAGFTTAGGMAIKGLVASINVIPSLYCAIKGDTTGAADNAPFLWAVKPVVALSAEAMRQDAGDDDFDMENRPQSIPLTYVNTVVNPAMPSVTTSQSSDSAVH